MAENTAANQEPVTWENEDTPEQIAASPDQVAIVWLGGEAVVASPAVSGDGTFDLDLNRLPADFNLGAAVNMRRDNLGVPRISENTAFLTIAPNFAERTKVLALDETTLTLGDEQLVEWLIEAERQVIPGTDDHPLFETTLEETACAVVRLPNQNMAMTEVPRQHIDSVREQMMQLSGVSDPERLRLTIETPVRSALRYYLTAVPLGAEAVEGGQESDVLALVLIGRTGFSFGLWNKGAGLFTEYGFPAPAELNAKPEEWAAVLRAVEGVEAIESQVDEARVNSLYTEFDFYVRQAFDQLLLQLSPETAGELGMSSFSKVVWATERGLETLITSIAGEYANYSGIEFLQLEVPADEAIASGLLLGSFNFGYDSVAGAVNLAQVNLARDLMVLADKEEMERRRLEDMLATQTRNRMILTLATPAILLLAIVLGIVVDTLRSSLMLSYRESQADSKAAELKPALDRRRSYERTLKWYQEFITQVNALKKQQPVGIGLLSVLNANYPVGIDPNFFVSEMKLTPKGEIELKGFSANKDAVAGFLRSLEFLGAEEGGKKLFTNLAYEVREGVEQAQGVKSATLSASALKGGKAAPGVVEWLIKGTYTPVEAIAPKEAPKGRRPGAPAPAPAGGAAPAAAPAPAAN